MGAYILRRILLIIPTMVGIMAISFAVVQFAPGGPIERIIAQLQGTDVSATARISGSGDFAGTGNQQGSGGGDETTSKYRGAQGLDPEFIKSLEKQFGFDKPPLERFGLMLWNYARFDFGAELFPRHQRTQADRREAAGFDLARPVDDAHLLRHLDPARHPQGGEGRHPLRHVDERCDHHRLRHPRLPVRDPADRAVRRRLVLGSLPAAGPDFGLLVDAAVVRQDSRLFLAYRACR